MQQRRAFLLDASCVIAGSHNPRACRLFARAFQRAGFAPRYVIPRHGETAFPGEEAAVERVLPYPYALRYGTIAGAPAHRADAGLHAIVERHRGEGAHRLLNRVLLPLADGRIAAAMKAAVAAELDRLTPGFGDAILLPTADLYASGAVLAWIGRRPPAAAPALILRFLNILERDAMHRPRARLQGLLRRAATLQRRGHRIVLAAEVEPWAVKLERRSGLPTLLLPTPPAPVAVPPRDPSRVGVSLISLRRGEQGAQRLVPILQAVPAKARDRLDVVGQRPRLRPGDALRAEGVRLIADELSETELAATLSGLDVTLLPYRLPDYAERGSSMLFEAANHGHRVLASAGCGFSADVERFGLGSLCDSDRAFAAALAALAREGNPRARSAAAAARYNDYRSACFERALQAAGG